MPDAPFDTADAAETAFYRAFAATDLTAMARVWHDGEEARCIHPGGGLLSGAGDVLDSWRQIFKGAVAPTVRHRLLHRADTGELSIHLVEEQIGPGNDPERGLTRILATNVYRQTTDGWRMVLHHATLPLVESGTQESAATSQSAGGEGGRLH